MITRPTVAAAALLLFACSPEASTSPNLEPSYARGGSGGGQPSGGTAISAVQLGDLRSLGCRSTSAAAINDAPQTVVGGSCSGSVTLNPFRWTTTGASVLPDTGDVLDVTASGAIVGRLDFRPFYAETGGTPIYLPMTTGFQWGEARAITPDGTFAIGGMSSQTNSSGALWRRSGSSWTVELFSGGLSGVSSNGAIIVGSLNRHATAWISPGGWTPASLSDNGAVESHAMAVNQDGTIIVGELRVPATSNPSVLAPKHAAWIADGSGGWTLQVLGGLNILEGTAYGVATQLDGSVVAVGESWDNTADPGGQLWAVAWRKPAGSSSFGPPVRLNPVSKGQGASASDINSKGEVVGYGTAKLGTVAVMWRLP